MTENEREILRLMYDLQIEREVVVFDVTQPLLGEGSTTEHAIREGALSLNVAVPIGAEVYTLGPLRTP